MNIGIIAYKKALPFHYSTVSYKTATVALSASDYDKYIAWPKIQK